MTASAGSPGSGGAAKVTRRLFVAVDVPVPVRAAVAEACRPLRAIAPDARWVDPARWHLTLAFLGAVPSTVVPATVTAVREAAAPTEAFELALDGRAGSFGRRVLWAGLAPSPPLDALAGRVRERLAASPALDGIAADATPFRAHLTLARAPSRGRLPEGLADRYEGPAATWRVEEVVLVRSVLAGSGSRYEVEAASALS